jgi:putative toxin-antitoxin system antitoxin component (TIGR02293 family)
LVAVIARAVAVFGDEKKASRWLATPISSLDDRIPAELLATEEGIDLVEQTLARIELSIPS